jgi:hypothetical protein
MELFHGASGTAAELRVLSISRPGVSHWMELRRLPVGIHATERAAPQQQVATPATP